MRLFSSLARCSLLAACALALGCNGVGCNGDSGDDDGEGAASPADLLRLHPENPRYFLFQGKPTVLITSGEHYGALINDDFDYERYLDELAEFGFNQTRVFSGSFIEPRDKFVVGYRNPLAPRPGGLVSPWPVTQGGKFDLEAWNPRYFQRLRDFVAAAEKRGIVVELVLFSALYEYERWDANPFNPANNVNGVESIDPTRLYTLDNEQVLAYQDELVRKLVSEVRSFGNVYFEVINEGYAEPAYATDEWETHIIETIEEAEAGLPHQHLIARNYDHTEPVTGTHPSVSVHNFHYQRDPSQYGNLDGVLAFDETGLQGIRDDPYRTDAWYFMLSGGGAYSNLDWSFTPDHEDGSFQVPPGTPGGGGDSIRRQLSVLKRFLERFEFTQMSPMHGIVKRAPAGATSRVLADPGRAYAVYLAGGRPGPLVLDLEKGRYRAQWIDTANGRVASEERFAHRGGPRSLPPPPYEEDIALAIER
jgi:hypothetical protein